ncbi:hypothetical protein EJO50_08940 [Iodobacter ciconiae]|uniref:Methyl-accepting transducer domain-containing protein n=1 Tax=Iodobacter ciconiae TaxID=2496266 RepID=A0A3S8ZXE1_9NEIS|nr:hypothetical protein EJO50_08940 [Iodobacter ciconiae]
MEFILSVEISISDQVNTLALNVALAAARTGKAGR